MRLTKFALLISAFFLLSLLKPPSQVLVSPSHPVEVGDVDYGDLERKYGVTFPIPELGNCTTFTDCLNFCADPVNYSACIDYAKSKGFYKEEDIDLKDEGFWERSKQELGCDSYKSCQAYCELPENYEACDAFAKSHNLEGGYEDDPESEEILGKAKEFLGCDSYESCRNFCERPLNYQRCSELAEKIGIRGGQDEKGPGGCTTDENCYDYCSDPGNFEVCSNYSRFGGEVFEGPGGCDSEESCRTYCSSNPDECRYFGAETVDPDDFCKKFPGKCQEFGGGTDSKRFEKYCLENPQACTGGGYGRSEVYKDFCSQNPDRCVTGPGGYPIPIDKSGWEEGTDDFCKKYPERCEVGYGYYKDGLDPLAECAKYEGCSWTGVTCECSVSDGDYIEDSSNQETECRNYGCTWTGTECNCEGTQWEEYKQVDEVSECTNYGCTWRDTYCDCSGTTYDSGTGDSYTSPPSDPATECANQGCNWTGTTCECGSTGGTTGGTQPDPATECTKQSGCSWTGSTCQCSGSDGSSGGTYSEGGYTAPPPDSSPTVYGTKTFVSWLQRLIQLLFGR